MISLHAMKSFIISILWKKKDLNIKKVLIFEKNPEIFGIFMNVKILMKNYIRKLYQKVHFPYLNFDFRG